jgi:hypothetical protein
VSVASWVAAKTEASSGVFQRNVYQKVAMVGLMLVLCTTFSGTGREMRKHCAVDQGRSWLLPTPHNDMTERRDTSRHPSPYCAREVLSWDWAEPGDFW